MDKIRPWPKEPTAENIINVMMTDDLAGISFYRNYFYGWIETG